jgi:hypothetical protein
MNQSSESKVQLKMLKQILLLKENIDEVKLLERTKKRHTTNIFLPQFTMSSKKSERGDIRHLTFNIDAEDFSKRITSCNNIKPYNSFENGAVENKVKTQKKKSLFKIEKIEIPQFKVEDSPPKEEKTTVHRSSYFNISPVASLEKRAEIRDNNLCLIQLQKCKEVNPDFYDSSEKKEPTVICENKLQIIKLKKCKKESTKNLRDLLPRKRESFKSWSNSNSQVSSDFVESRCSEISDSITNSSIESHEKVGNRYLGMSSLDPGMRSKNKSFKIKLLNCQINSNKCNLNN